ncbi:MAG: exodeoxyribonuclease VII large subunit [Candidatus Paracaedibacteraceae bacterium]|nr:exodeoxyribonuclease VII large subunit [Candidatus Paracaedibacteraceae bacterium]
MSETQLFSETTSLIPVLSVSDLSNALKRTVEDQFNFVRIKGEISGLKRHTSGHIYYALKDENAVMDAVSWRGSYSKNPIQLEDGLEIIATGRITTYPARSKYQMVVESYEASGQGALLKLLEERKRLLAAEGLFAAERKKQIPKFPQTIGVITSPTGAVIRDILHRIKDRFPCHVIVWPVAVQGVGAAEQITAAIQGFNAMPNRPDVLIVARGGGSLEDLWAFNEELVVRAAANSQIPLISAVGHETDTTLIDYAADLRAPTPTGAAEFTVPVLAELMGFLEDRSRRQLDVMHHILDHRTLQLTSLERGLINPQRLIEEGMQRVDDWSDRLIRALPQLCQIHQDRLAHTFIRLRHPKDQLELCLERFNQLSTRLDQASFQKVLDRGFAMVTTESGESITCSRKFPNTPVNLMFGDGKVEVIKTGGSLPHKKKKEKTTAHQPSLF